MICHCQLGGQNKYFHKFIFLSLIQTGQTPFDQAVENSHLDLMEYLLLHGANMSSPINVSGQCPRRLPTAMMIYQCQLILVPSYPEVHLRLHDVNIGLPATE